MRKYTKSEGRILREILEFGCFGFSGKKEFFCIPADRARVLFAPLFSEDWCEDIKKREPSIKLTLSKSGW